MKRLLPVIIALCLIGAVFVCLPRSSSGANTPDSLEDLNGCRVGIQTGLNYDIILSRICPEAEPVYFSEFPSMFPALQQGKVDAILTESVSFIIEGIEHPALRAIDKPLSSIDVSIGVGDDRLGKKVLHQLNEFIGKLKEDGTYDEMMSYWFYEYDRGNAYADKSGITGENGVLSFTSEASYEPVCFAAEGGELQGYDIDFIYRFCREYGYEPRITPLEYDAMAAAIASGKCTVAMGLIKDEERAEEISFTDPYIAYDIIAVYDSGTDESDSFTDSLINSFQKTFIRENRWQMFLKGSGITLLISGLSVLFGTGLGLMLYLWCAQGKKAEQTVTDILCWLAGSTPTVVLLMILYYVLFGAYNISNVAVAIVGFSYLFGTSFYEKIVSGVKAVGTGQVEAARAQGFSANQTFFRIVFPQAIEHFFPEYQADVISLIQETSVVGYIAVMDLTKMSDLVRGRTYEAFFPLLATACIYFLMIWIMTSVLRRVSISVNSKNRSREDILKGIKT